MYGPISSNSYAGHFFEHTLASKFFKTIYLQLWVPNILQAFRWHVDFLVINELWHFKVLSKLISYTLGDKILYGSPQIAQKTTLFRRHLMKGLYLRRGSHLHIHTDIHYYSGKIATICKNFSSLGSGRGNGIVILSTKYRAYVQGAPRQ